VGSLETRSVGLSQPLIICYGDDMRKDFLIVTLLGLVGLFGCVTSMSAIPERVPAEDKAVAIGRVVTVLTGPTTRWYTPQLRFFEVVNSTTGERIRVDVQSDDAWFVLPLPAGEYELSRIQISEGAFLGMAGLEPRFQVNAGEVTYVGSWRFGVESPQYNRTVLLSAVAEDQAAVRQALARYPELNGRPVSTELLEPSTVETRLFEVPPYPRFWWFRRHHTS